ncbi:hypothetical protein CPter91_3290 [Collimonas pratensis]|uniref:Uncharacterized protein n=1 Tax=Collimonas pratensis TaxID=279113 RepID=A0A127Q6G1_9BURK|nr:hypothetical protein CPter91_3290 [Collimonas pratensis]
MLISNKLPKKLAAIPATGQPPDFRGMARNSLQLPGQIANPFIASAHCARPGCFFIRMRSG